MYKGNMDGFLEKLKEYLERRYECTVMIGRWFGNKGREGPTLRLNKGCDNTLGEISVWLKDEVDFEEQAYLFVNERLKILELI